MLNKRQMVFLAGHESHTLCCYQKIKNITRFVLPLFLGSQWPHLHDQSFPKSGKGPKCSLKVTLCLEATNVPETSENWAKLLPFTLLKARCTHIEKFIKQNLLVVPSSSPYTLQKT